jgi:hypothetical protein
MTLTVSVFIPKECTDMQRTIEILSHRILTPESVSHETGPTRLSGPKKKMLKTTTLISENEQSNVIFMIASNTNVNALYYRQSDSFFSIN